jgi:cation transport regulator ChaB
VPKTTRTGKPKKDELPSTLQHSDAKAQRTFAKAHDAAADQYGEGRRAHQVAYAALKHTHERSATSGSPRRGRVHRTARRRVAGTRTSTQPAA